MYTSVARQMNYRTGVRLMFTRRSTPKPEVVERPSGVRASFSCESGAERDLPKKAFFPAYPAMVASPARLWTGDECEYELKAHSHYWPPVSRRT